METPCLHRQDIIPPVSYSSEPGICNPYLHEKHYSQCQPSGCTGFGDNDPCGIPYTQNNRAAFHSFAPALFPGSGYWLSGCRMKVMKSGHKNKPELPLQSYICTICFSC